MNITAATYLTENDRLADGNETEYVGESAILGLEVVALDIELLDVGERLVLAAQTNDHGLLDDACGEVYHRIFVCGREKHELTRGRQTSAPNTHKLFEIDYRS